MDGVKKGKREKWKKKKIREEGTVAENMEALRQGGKKVMEVPDASFTAVVQGTGVGRECPS